MTCIVPSLQAAHADAVMLRRCVCVKAFDVFQVLDALATVQEQLRAQVCACALALCCVSMLTPACRTQTDAFSANLRLIVVDSVSAVVGPFLGGESKKGDKNEGFAIMMKLAHTLRFLAQTWDLAVLVRKPCLRRAVCALSPDASNAWWRRRATSDCQQFCAGPVNVPRAEASAWCVVGLCTARTGVAG